MKTTAPHSLNNIPETLLIEKSQSLWERAKGLIPAGTQTLAKGPALHVDGASPKYLDKGKGARVWDVDGNEFLDMTMGLGPLSLGYQNPVVDQAIKDQLAKGITFSLMHHLEVEVAELIRDTIPNVESVRFSKSGADAASAAVRVARAFTGREHVVCNGYHGWHDWYISTTDKNKGIPNGVGEVVSTINYNDIESVKKAVRKDTACVILEPVRFEAPKDGFLEELRSICDENGTLLIFDEMWTGFRLALGGAQEYFGVKADMACYSKAIANGMPISVLAGRQDVMSVLDQEVFFYTTFGGEALSLAATKATIGELKKHDVPKHIASMGKKLRDGFNERAKAQNIDWVHCGGMDYRTFVGFSPDLKDQLIVKSVMQQEIFRRGVLWAGSHTLSASHSNKDIDFLLDVFGESMAVVDGHIKNDSLPSALRGEPIRSVFKSTQKPRG